MQNRPIIIKRVKKVAGHGHHGGAWKVAYADFVTAMMAFFLLLWLLNVTTDEQKQGIADYFTPASLSRVESGAGGILGGRTMTSQGSRVSEMGVPSVVLAITPPAVEGPETEAPREPDEAEVERKLAEREQEAFEETRAILNQAIDEVPELADLKRHLIVDMTPEGLRIQIVDQENQSMFPTGSTQMHERTRLLLQKIAQVVARLPNKISISGHTDAAPFRAEAGYGNWELSSDRANASRRMLLEAGLPGSRIAQVTGKADQELLYEAEPLNPSNRRISIVLLREAPVLQGARAERAQDPAPAAAADPG